jgi:glutaredoxin
MSKIEIYSKSWCPYCNKAKTLLKSKGMSYREVDTTASDSRQAAPRTTPNAGAEARATTLLVPDRRKSSDA